MTDLSAQYVSSQLLCVPAAAEVAMRLGSLDARTLAAVVGCDPEGFKRWAADTADLAKDLQALAEAIADVAARVGKAG
jgi:hypothetical protein